MKFSEFLDLIKVLRMLFGVPIAKKFFLTNLKRFDKIIDSDSLNNLK